MSWADTSGRRASSAVTPAEASVLVAVAVGAPLCFFLGTEILGAVASVIAFVLWLPQALRTWRLRGDARALAGVSLITQALVLANAALWAGYGLGTGALWVAAPGAVNAPLALLVMALVVRSRLVGAREPREPLCEHCESGRWHRVFITAPPGWGSVMPCSGATRPHGVVVIDDSEIEALRSGRDGPSAPLAGRTDENAGEAGEQA